MKKRKILIPALILTVLFSLAMIFPSAIDLKFDVTGDKIVDVYDLIRLIGNIGKSYQQRYDFNADKKIDLLDAIMMAESITGPLGKKSDAPVSFAFHTDAGGRNAVSVSGKGVVSCRFKATADFDSLILSCPSYSDNVGSLTFSLYKWQDGYKTTVASTPVAVNTYRDFKDNANLTFSFSKMPAGEYLLALSNGEKGVGIWAFSESKTGTFLYADGTESDGVFTMTVHYLYTPNQFFSPCRSIYDFANKVTTPPEPVLSPDDPLILLDAMPDTWAATDALGRTLPTNEETGGVRKGKTVGLFFWTWHSGQSGCNPTNLNDLMEAHPEAQNDYTSSVWNGTGPNYHWNEPIYGYYNGLDRWVFRKQAELLASSGVDVIFFDNTNGRETWQSGYLMLCEVFEEARKQGVNTPKISFLLPFADGEDTVAQLRQIYLTIYRESLYQDLWFYWEGKPLIMAHSGKLDKTDQIENEIADFFTFRAGEPSYNSARKLTGKWTWLSVYPQAVTYRADGSAEQMTVGVAQNWSSALGLTAMNGKNIFGRTYTSKGIDTRENAKLYGANFDEQFSYALDVDPDFIFITGWNEWIAGRFETWQSVKNAFPDEFNDTYSRDIEPTKGELGDNYYYQMVSFIRRYKGTRPAPAASGEKTINISGALSQWDDVLPRYVAYRGNTFDRDCAGYGNLHYTDKTGRNDLTFSKVARDKEKFYFLCQCAESITPYVRDTGWMRLWLDLGENLPHWESFEAYLQPTGNGKADVMLCKENGWHFEKVGEADYTVIGNSIQIAVSRSLLPAVSSFGFKWTDNTCLTGDIMEVYIHGDAAPGGRYRYRYLPED